MPDLLGATNPVPNYDNTGRNQPISPAQVQDPRVQNAPAPGRVSRADGRSERQGADNSLESGGVRYDSNLQAFLQQLRDTPELAEVMARTILRMRGMVAAPGLSEGISGELAQLFTFLQMDEEGLGRFFLSQMQAGNRFSGPVFSLLRQAYQHANDSHVREAILEFARRYSDFSSTGHICENIRSLLQQMGGYLPRSWRGQLTDLLAQLENGMQAGSRLDNLKLLQGAILPFLGSYIQRSHDMGKIRTMISLLTLNVVRYENGDEEGLLASFRQLSGYGELLTGLNQLDDQAILRLLRENPFARSVQSDQFAQQFASAASQAMQGRYGAEVRDGFQEIVRAMLVNESVYMPLNHTVLPLEWKGRTMYSELWVDPDAEDEDGKNGKSSGEKVQFLFKMDIQSLGFLEMTLAARQDQVDLAVYGPDWLERWGGLVAEDLGEILKSHGLSGRSVKVARRERPLTLTEVFPNLFDGKRSVNVKV